MDEAVATVKKIIRTRKTVSTQSVPAEPTIPLAASGSVAPQILIIQSFDDLMIKLTQSKQEFDSLQKQINETKEGWVREQKAHEIEIIQQKTQQELERKREQETYEYSTSLARKRAEDEFQDKRQAWEKELTEKKEELEDQRKELENLRKLVDGFDSQKEQAVEQAQSLIEKQLTEQFENQTKMREQEFKSEKELLGLKIANLEAENSRLTKEIEVLKRSLEEATKQVKEIAVKVIESGSSQTKLQSSSQE